MAYEVVTDGPQPTHHIRMTDGEEVIGLIFCNPDGTPNERAFAMSPYPRQALKTSQGESKYSDLEPPFFTKAQDDWTGGRAYEDFDKDATKYYDGSRLDATKSDGMVLGGEETYCKGYRDVIQNMPDSMSWRSLHVTGGGTYTRQVATQINDGPSTAFVSTQCELWIRKIGTPPANLIVSIYDTTGSAPNASVASYSIAPTAISDVLGVLYAFPWTGATTTDTTYYVVADGGAGATPNDHWEVGVIAGNGFTSTVQNAFSAATIDLAYRIVGTLADFTARFFSYKGAMYYYTQPEAGGASTLYRNGWRGAADSNAGQLDKLIDATQSWTADRLIGATAVITKGPGAEEAQPWRRITDNDATSITVSPSWNVAHTTDTEYVVLDTDWWVSCGTLTYYVTGATVANDFVYFCRGEDYTILRYQEYNNAGVWTTRSNADVLNGKEAVCIRHSEEGDTLWIAGNEDATYDVCVARTKVPPKWGNLYTDIGTLVETDKPWDAQSITNVTQSTNNGATRISIAAGFTTGLAAVRNLSPAVDITEGKRLGFLIKSSVATSLGDLQLKYDEDLNLGQDYAPTSVKHYHRDRDWLPTSLMQFVGAGETWSTKSKAADGDTATGDEITLVTADYLYVACGERFNIVNFNLGTTKNAVDSTLSAEMFDGALWTSITITDGTKTGAKTMAASGDVTFTPYSWWEQCTKNSVTGYMIRFKVSVDLTAAVDFQEVCVQLKEDYTTLDYLFDGDSTTETLSLTTSDYLFVISNTRFNKMYFTINTGNTQAATMLGWYWNGGQWTALTLADTTFAAAATLNTSGSITFTIPHDWAQFTIDGVTGYPIRLYPSANLDSNIIIRQITLQKSSNLTKNIPALVANQWEWVSLAITPQAYPQPNEAAIQSVGLYVAVDNGAQTVDILGGIKILRNSAEYYRLPADARITGMDTYAGAVEDPVSNPWIFTENAVYELQSQNDNIIVPLPLKELSAMASTDNGISHTTNGVYLYFNLGNRIEKYYNRTLDDVGPDRDAGLPSSRQGLPSCMVSLPGRVAVGMDANTGTSSVLYNTGNAWHEAYRAPRAGLRIRALGVQPIPGKQSARLWISQGDDVLWIPFSLNPYTDSDYRYTHEGHLITGWHYAGMQDVYKLWSELKLFLENTLIDQQYIVADYQVDDDDTWTEIDSFEAIPVEAIDIAATLPRSRRIRFRLRFYTTDHAQTPRVKAMTVEGVGFVPVKRQCAFTFILDPALRDLRGRREEKTPEDVTRSLLTWANDGHELHVDSIFGILSDWRCFIDPYSISPLRMVPATPYGRYIGKLNLIEV